MNKRSWLLSGIILAVLTGLLWLNATSDVGLLNLYNEQEEDVSSAPSEPVEAEEKPEMEPAVQKPVEPPAVVVIDPGHQEKANLEMEPIGPGAQEEKYKVTGGTTGAATKKPEYVLNLEASFRLKEVLESRGVKVVLTRETHDINMSNSERAEVANTQQADLFIRLHADGSENPETRGFSILVPDSASPYTSAIASKSEQAAKAILQEAARQLDIHQPGLFYRDDMSGFNWSKVPVVLLEIGFMTNLEEDRLLSDPDYLDRVMTLSADGVMNYLKETGK